MSSGYLLEAMPAHHSGSRRYPKPPAPVQGQRQTVHGARSQTHAPARSPVAPAKRSARFLTQNEAPISADEETARHVPVRRSEAAAAPTGGGGSMPRHQRTGYRYAGWRARRVFSFGDRSYAPYLRSERI